MSLLRRVGWADPQEAEGVVQRLDDWQRLLALLEPIHHQAAATARRLSRSRFDGDDLYQEAVLRAHDKLSSLRDPARFRSWFYRVLLSVHRNRSRRSFWRRFVSLDDRAAREGFDPPGEDGAAWDAERRQADRASRALASLPTVQREAVVLFEIDGFSVDEIAAIQHVSASAVKSRLARGRDRLRRHYERMGVAPPRDAQERHEEKDHEGSSWAICGGEEVGR